MMLLYSLFGNDITYLSVECVLNYSIWIGHELVRISLKTTNSNAIRNVGSKIWMYVLIKVTIIIMKERSTQYYNVSMWPTLYKVLPCGSGLRSRMSLILALSIIISIHVWHCNIYISGCVSSTRSHGYFIHPDVPTHNIHVPTHTN